MLANDPTFAAKSATLPAPPATPAPSSARSRPMTRTARTAKLPAAKSRVVPRAGPAPRSTVIRAIPLRPKASGPAWLRFASDPLAGGRTGSGETRDHMPSSRPPIQPRATGMHANRLASPHPRAARQCRHEASGFRSAIASPGPWRSRPLREERLRSDGR